MREDEGHRAIAQVQFIPDLDLLKRSASFPVPFLPLEYGDKVVVLSQEDDWAYGYIDDLEHKEGIFPVDGVHFIELRPPAPSLPSSLDGAIVQDISIAIRELWTALEKRHTSYSVFDHFMRILERLSAMRVILQREDRRPESELQFLRKIVASMIDKANSYLKLPLSLRHDDCSFFLMDELSIGDTYHRYVKKDKDIRQNLNMDETTMASHEKENKSEPVSILIEVVESTMSLWAEVEFQIYLYDVRKRQLVSEPFFFRLSEIHDKQKRVKCVFLHLAPSLDLESTVLITRAARFTTVEAVATLKRGQGDRLREAENAPTQLPPVTRSHVRQPFAYDIQDLKTILTHLDQRDNFYQALLVKSEHFDQTLSRWAVGKVGKMDQTDDDATLTMRVVHFRGTLDVISRQYSHLFLTKPPRCLCAMEMTEQKRDDLRNEMYLTLHQGEFLSRAVDKKNIGVRLCMVTDKDKVIRGSFEKMGRKRVRKSSHSSYVIINEDRPKWNETVKISLNNSFQCNVAYLRFTFYVKRSESNKTRHPKVPFALAFLKVFDNGAIVQNGFHDLLVFKIEQAEYKKSNPQYLHLPSTRHLPSSTLSTQAISRNVRAGPFHYNDKCKFIVSSLVCSGVIPVSKTIRSVLHHRKHPTALPPALNEMVVYPEIVNELVQFAPSIIESMCHIWDDRNDVNDKVFNALMYVLSLHDDARFERYRGRIYAVADNIASTSAGYHMLSGLHRCLTTNIPRDTAKVMVALKNLAWIGRAVVQSARIGRLVGADSLTASQTALKTVIESIVKLLSDPDKSMAVVQNIAIKRLPELIVPILQTTAPLNRRHSSWRGSKMSSSSSRNSGAISLDNGFSVDEKPFYDPIMLVEQLREALRGCSDNVTNTQRANYMKRIYESPLFAGYKLRAILLPVFMYELTRQVAISAKEAHQEDKMRVSSEASVVMFNMIENLFPTREGRRRGGETVELELIMCTAFREVVITTIHACSSALPNTSDDAKSRVCTLLLILLHHMSAPVFRAVLKTHADEKVELLEEVILVIKTIIMNRIYPQQWVQMERIKFRVIDNLLKQVQSIQQTLHNNSRFDVIWKEYMLTLNAVIASASARSVEYEDHLLIDAEEFLQYVENAVLRLRSTWFMLSPVQKVRHVPILVRDFVGVALVASTNQGEIINILCDMMKADYNACETDNRNFDMMAKELFLQLDEYIGNQKKGEDDFYDIFVHHLHNYLSGDEEMWRAGGEELFETIKVVLGLVFQHKDAYLNPTCNEMKMIIIVQLLEYYEKMEHTQLAVRYVYLLYDLHMEEKNYIEAAHTLRKHAAVTRWENAELPEYVIQSNRNRNCATERQLKAALLIEIAELFTKGALYEEAIQTYREVMPYYENTVVDYIKMSEISAEVGRLFKEIRDGFRPDSYRRYHYRVSFFGQGFGDRANQILVYNSYKTRLDFVDELMSTFENADQINGEFEKYFEKPGKYFNVAPVHPVENELPFEGTDISDTLRYYYRNFNMKRFTYPVTQRKQGKWFNYAQGEAAKDALSVYTMVHTVVTAYPLPNILKFAKVVHRPAPTCHTPLHIAIENMKKTNEDLLRMANNLAKLPKENKLTLKDYQMKLNGQLNPQVAGGVSNYWAFFNEEIEKDEEEVQLIAQLKDLIIRQVALQEYCIFVHKNREPIQQNILIRQFREQKKMVEQHLGAIAESMIPPDATLEDDFPLAEPSTPSSTAKKGKFYTSKLRSAKSPRESTSLESPRGSLASGFLFSPPPPPVCLTRPPAYNVFTPNTLSRLSMRTKPSFEQFRQKMAPMQVKKMPRVPSTTAPPLPQRRSEGTLYDSATDTLKRRARSRLNSTIDRVA